MKFKKYFSVASASFLSLYPSQALATSCGECWESDGADGCRVISDQVTLTCSGTQMTLVVNECVMGNTSVDLLRLENNSVDDNGDNVAACSNDGTSGLSGSSGQYTAQVSLDCAKSSIGQNADGEDIIIFTQELSAVLPEDADTLISFSNTNQIEFSCGFPVDYEIRDDYQVEASIVSTQAVSDIGSFEAHFKLNWYTDSNYNQLLTDTNNLRVGSIGYVAMDTITALPSGFEFNTHTCEVVHKHDAGKAFKILDNNVPAALTLTTIDQSYHSTQNRMSYKIFEFRGATNNEMQLNCNVKVCKSGDDSACRASATYTAPSGNEMTPGTVYHTPPTDGLIDWWQSGGERCIQGTKRAPSECEREPYIVLRDVPIYRQYDIVFDLMIDEAWPPHVSNMGRINIFQLGNTPSEKFPALFRTMNGHYEWLGGDWTTDSSSIPCVENRFPGCFDYTSGHFNLRGSFARTNAGIMHLDRDYLDLEMNKWYTFTMTVRDKPGAVWNLDDPNEWGSGTLELRINAPADQNGGMYDNLLVFSRDDHHRIFNTDETRDLHVGWPTSSGFVPFNAAVRNMRVTEYTSEEEQDQVNSGGDGTYTAPSGNQMTPGTVYHTPPTEGLTDWWTRNGERCIQGPQVSTCEREPYIVLRDVPIYRQYDIVFDLMIDEAWPQQVSGMGSINIFQLGNTPEEMFPLFSRTMSGHYGWLGGSWFTDSSSIPCIENRFPGCFDDTRGSFNLRETFARTNAGIINLNRDYLDLEMNKWYTFTITVRDKPGAVWNLNDPNEWGKGTLELRINAPEDQNGGVYNDLLVFQRDDHHRIFNTEETRDVHVGWPTGSGFVPFNAAVRNMRVTEYTG